MIEHPDFTEQDTSGDVNLVGLLVGFLSLGLILFAVLAIYGFGQAHRATASLQSGEAAAAKTAKAAQKATDDKAQLAANESPFRSYTAPGDFGSFVIYFPKNWSGYVQTNTNGMTQVDLALNPDFISATNGIPADPVAARVKLVQALTPSEISPYTGLVKLGKLKQQDITVSGIKGTEITGTFPDNITVATVFLPVRGQTMLISCENSKYLPEYNVMLSQAKINP